MDQELLTGLEARIAFLEKDISDLGAMVVAQQRQIQELEKQLQVAVSRLRQVQHAVQEPPSDDIPPHY